MNAVLSEVNGDRQKLPGELSDVRFCDFVYADDILYALAHKQERVAEQAGLSSARIYQHRLQDRGLGMTPSKSENFLIPSQLGGQSLFR